MKNINFRIGYFMLTFLLSQLVIGQNLSLRHLSTYSTGIFDDGAAEIVAHDSGSNRIFFVNANNATVDVLDITDPINPILINSIGVTQWGKSVNSVAVKNGVVAVAIENSISTDNGRVVFFDVDGNYIKDVIVGALPDMLTFTNNGTKVLVANEGEPNDSYDIDPEGSVTIIDLMNPIAGATSKQITFEAFNLRKASLMNKGIRIFGPNATVAQDLEPEYITVSDDDKLAYVVCQENNAIVVIEIETATVLDILPLGEKDHSRGTPILEEHLLNEIPNWIDLGTPVYDGGETVQLGGFSGLYFDEPNSTDSTYIFYTIPDRGPNNSTVSKSLAGTSQNLRPFKLPDYQSRIVKVVYDVNSKRVSFDETEQVFLTQSDGITPISGRGNIPGFDEVPVTFSDTVVYTNSDFDIDGTQYHQLDYDPFGGDFEGILRDNNGDFWMCDEYRPAIYHFEENGTLIQRYVPEGTAQLGDTPQPVGTYGTETLPAVYSKRRANRGFEAIAYDNENEIIYAFIQSPMYNPNSSTRNNSDVIRILGIDPSNGQPVAEYVYLLERNRYAGLGLSRVDKIGDAVYIGDGRFMVLERDSSTPDDGDTGKKYIYEINIKGATNILGTPISNKDSSTGPDDKTLEMMSADDLIANGIQSVYKIKMLNLPSIGYHPSDKPEGLAYLPNGTIAVLNDNDFGLAGAGVTDNSTLGLISFTGDYGFDASNKDDSILIKSRQTLGMYMPDAIRSFSVDGKNYLITANEGDARDYDGYSEEVRGDDLILDTLLFADLDTLQTDQELGRLKTTMASGDIDGDGTHEYFYSYGARSFSIWDENGNLIFDSGDDFEQILATQLPNDFNSTNDENDSFDNRSDDKGPEPEAVEIANINGELIAFIGLERVGGIMVYNISNPKEPEFIEYINNRQFDVAADSMDINGNFLVGDLGIEDIKFISAEDSPNGIPLLITGNEVSGTVSIFGMDIRPTVSFVDDASAFDEDAGIVEVEIVVETAGTMRGTFEVSVVDASTAIDTIDYILGTSTFEIFELQEDGVKLEIELNDNANAYDGRYLILKLDSADDIEFGKEEEHILLIKDNDVVAPEPITSADVQLTHLTSYRIDTLGGTAEIIAFDPLSKTLYTTNSELNALELVNADDPANLAPISTIDLSIYGGGVNSVAVQNEIVAVAIEASPKQNPGKVVFFDTAGNYLNEVETGALPDMLAFTPDGTKILIANEGEPSDDYTIDPEGSVTIIDISSGVMSAVTTHITFESFNDQYDALKEEGVRLFGPNASVAQDLEPEFIAFGFDGETALVSCQENNALIGIDLNTNTILGIGALGEKDWSQIPNAFDSSNKSPDVFFANWNVKSFYQPDAIATYEVNGETYIITANEGDARDYDGYSEEERVDDLVLDPTVYPDAKYLQNDVLLGRLKTTTVNGDTDGDGDIDQIYAYGGRSFSIWNATTQQLIWDSGDQLERITQNDPVFGQIFNTTDDENEARNRSDDKGPEPEAVAIGEIDGRFYAFIGLERIGGIMLYEVTDPTNPTFIQYINTRQVEELGGDLAPEGLAYISADESPNGKPLLAVSYEVSGTIGMFEIETQCEIELGDDVTICENEFAELKADDNFMGYVWSTGETTQIINVNSTGTYEVSGITDYGCEATDQIEVTVLDTLTLNLGNDITICEDEIVTLEGPIGGITYLWSTGVFSQDLDVIDAGVYGLTVKNNDGCRSQDEIEVFVNPIPTVDIGNDTLVCEVAGPFVLNAGSDLMYFWNTGEVTQSIEVTQTGNYEVTVENEFGCEAEDEILVIVENCVGTTEAILDGDLNIYPNPTSGFLNIEMNDFEEGEYKMEVLDLTGRIIENESITVFGDYNTSLDLQSLSGGTYLLKIKSENGILVRRLMVLP